MKQLFVMDPLEAIIVDGDSTYVLMLEACRRGWTVAMCTPDDLFSVDHEAFARIQIVSVHEKPPFFVPKDPVECKLGEFDVVWMRKDPPFDINYIFSTYLLEMVPSSTLVLNCPQSLRSSNEKMYALQWAEHCTPTMVTSNVEQAISWAKKTDKRVVVKPWDGNGGRGVLVSHGDDGNLRSMLEMLTGNGQTHVMIQHYIPEITEGDKRIILVEGEPVGWMLRVPSPGDHRGNMHVGAQVKRCELTEKDMEICRAMGPRLRDEGLLFVGIDVIGSYLTEINVTSPTGIREINALMGTKIEKLVTDAVIARLDRHRIGDGR